MIFDMDGNQFTNENYTPYGNLISRLLHGHTEDIIGYTLNPEYYLGPDKAGVMFINKFGRKVWSEIDTDKLLRLIGK